MESNLAHPDMMVGSDGTPELNGSPHPRLFGTFPRVLARYVREQGILTVEAIRRMTALPAATFGMTDRGQIRTGYWADLVLFDPAKIADLATYDNPRQEPAGVNAVWVNGQLALRDGVHPGVGAGKMLRYQRSAHGE